MRLIRLAILVVALIVLVLGIGGLLLGWRTGSLNTSLCMLLLALILRRSQDADPGERTMPPSGVLALAVVGIVLSGFALARGFSVSDDLAPLNLLPLTLLGDVLRRHLKGRRKGTSAGDPPLPR
ncbi:hypothetical protein E4J66_07780 [Actinomyces viscosus]|uniref:Uncharacterized protein n=1 Tax=Actinomyces viscosus TaxID=1656 RepID=A0A448PN03_ACTVI|nr:hypothetical protein [Actinomyces viscosus]TFH52518.1 hypothetical protein E4J66_07780 [Actinomyces viscosus]VEI17351.1 Uncharacterised protein [Actinomyces viscosus]